jgi:hypothetical protein
VLLYIRAESAIVDDTLGRRGVLVTRAERGDGKIAHNGWGHCPPGFDDGSNFVIVEDAVAMALALAAAVGGRRGRGRLQRVSSLSVQGASVVTLLHTDGSNC